MANLFSRLIGRTPENEEFRLSLGEAAKMFGSSSSQFNMWRSSGYGNRPEEVSDNFEGLVNGAYKTNGVVFAVMMARMSIFSEARFLWQPLEKGKASDRLFGTEELAIFEKPWPNGTTGDLLARAIQDVDLCGNHYVVKERRDDGSYRLRRLRPDWVSIMLSSPSETAVAEDVIGYIYKHKGSSDPKDWTVFPIDGSMGEIAHWCPIPDPDAAYRGMSWLTPVLSEITADRMSTKHKLKFFENGATPNLAVSFKETVTAEQLEEFKRMMEASHGGTDSAYRTMYLGGGADVKVVGADMKQLDFKVSQGAAETRIAAAGRVHPSLVGLSEGLQGSSLNEGNFAAAKANFGDATLRPLWRSLCAAYEVLVDPPNGGVRLWFDSSDINFLRQDRKDQAELQAKQSDTIAKYVMNGFDPQSAIDAVNADDLALLKHTGLVSVQLLPPGTVAKGSEPAKGEEGEEPDDKKKTSGSGQNTANIPPAAKAALKK